MKKAIIYIHGKGGNHREAEQYRQNCPECNIYGVDYQDDFPWVVQEKILDVYNRLNKKYDCIYVLANSIGAYFSMHTLQKADIKKAFFISPILDMERLILDMMRWAEVSEDELAEKKRFLQILEKPCHGNISVMSERILFHGKYLQRFCMGKMIL